MVRKIFLVLSFLVLSNNAFADDAKLAKDFVNNFGNKVIKIASNPAISVNERRNQLIKLIDSVVDSEWVSKFILAKNYRTLTDAQKDKFQNLYRDFMIYTYAPSFKGYNGQTFEVTDVLQQGQYFLTKCFFIPKEGPKVNLSFRLKKNAAGNGFSLLDITAEGVSLIETQRSEFGAVIAEKGIDGLIKDLEVRVQKLKAENKGVAAK